MERDVVQYDTVILILSIFNFFKRVKPSISTENIYTGAKKSSHEQSNIKILIIISDKDLEKQHSRRFSTLPRWIRGHQLVYIKIVPW